MRYFIYLLGILFLSSCTANPNTELPTETDLTEETPANLPEAETTSSIRDFKVKTENNEAERLQMLDMIRTEIYEEIEQEIVFVVNHFMVSAEYAYLEAEVVRKDGKPIEFPDEYYDCCHTQAVFAKENNHWQTASYAAFATDCWYCGIAAQYPNAPKEIFSTAALMEIE
jgi:hypothetical protein